MNGPFYDQGVYIGEIVSQGLSKAKTGTTQFVLRFKVLGRPDPDDDTALSPVTQYERTMYMAITDKTVEYVAANLRQLGYTADSFGPLEPSHPKHESFVGNQVDLYCKHENDQNGAPRERWQLSRKMTINLEPKEVRQLDMLFGKALKGASAPFGAPSAPSTRTATASAITSNQGYERTEITDDDIPF